MIDPDPRRRDLVPKVTAGPLPGRYSVWFGVRARLLPLPGVGQYAQRLAKRPIVHLVTEPGGDLMVLGYMPPEIPHPGLERSDYEAWAKDEVRKTFAVETA